MGRARRNQRDDIRKRRALKRKKIFGDSDDVDSSLAKTLRKINEVKQDKCSRDGCKVESNLENNSQQLKEADNVITDDTNVHSECSEPTSQEEASRAVKPLDNIERMRMRKRERKAKRQAKKESNKSML
jgi:paraquat-inducible protein B